MVIDPFSPEIGLRVPKLSADVLLVTHEHYDHNNTKAVEGQPFLITGPGEYEVKGILVHGIPSFHDEVGGKKRGPNVIYTIEGEEIRLCHLGDFGQPELTSEQLDALGEVDILMIPVGGVYTINGREAARIISQIEPKIVIPMHFSLPKLKVKLEEPGRFLKTVGLKSVEHLPKLSIKKKDLPSEGMRVVVLKP